MVQYGITPAQKKIEPTSTNYRNSQAAGRPCQEAPEPLLEKRMTGTARFLKPQALSRFGPLFVFALSVARLSAQGPPFQIDDPVPVDLHHYEFYIFGSMDGTSAEVDATGPAIEFHWGALPRLQIHSILPLGDIAPSNNPIYFPAGTGPSAFGLIDAELGAKIAFFKETKYVPQIGTFTMFEIPTGSYSRGLGVGKVWYKVPLWLQKNIGHWLLDGGAGYTIIPQTGYRNFPYGGFLLKYAFGKRLEIGGELFSHGREGFATPQTQASTMLDIGGYYHLKNHPGEQFLFCYGHSIAGQTEQYAYLGMYWTWGKEDKKPDSAAFFPTPPYLNSRQRIAP